jgi:hypothetical protein
MSAGTTGRAADPRCAVRAAVREAYFGELAPNGESRARFVLEVQRLCDLRDELVGSRLPV